MGFDLGDLAQGAGAVLGAPLTGGASLALLPTGQPGAKGTIAGAVSPEAGKAISDLTDSFSGHSAYAPGANYGGAPGVANQAAGGAQLLGAGTASTDTRLGAASTARLQGLGTQDYASGANAGYAGLNGLQAAGSQASNQLGTLGVDLASRAQGQGAAANAQLGGLGERIYGTTAAQGAAQQAGLTGLGTSIGNRFGDLGNALYNQGGPTLDTTGTGAQRSAISGAQGQQNAALNLLQQAAEGKGPSAASSVMQAGLDRSLSDQLAAANSTRGAFGAANAGRQAVQAGALQQQQSANQAATLRAQEMQAAQAQFAGASNAAVGANTGAFGAESGLALGAGNLQQASRALNTNALLNASQFGASQQAGLAQSGAQLAQGYDTLGTNNLASLGAHGADLASGYNLAGMSAQGNLTAQGVNAGLGATTQGYSNLLQGTQLGINSQLTAEQLAAQQGLNYSQLGQQQQLAYNQLAHSILGSQLGADVSNQGIHQGAMSGNAAAASQAIGKVISGTESAIGAGVA